MRKTNPLCPARSALALLAVTMAGCAAAPAAKPSASGTVTPTPEQAYQSTYAPATSETFVIRNIAVLLAGDGAKAENTDVYVRDGRIAQVGPALQTPAGTREIDAAGLWATPGIIDAHSHLGTGPSPNTASHRDYNETSAPVTAFVWIEHSVWPQDPGFATALAGGVTTLQVLPGSANLIGGRGMVLKNVRVPTVQQMKFPGAPQALKMACGENPKRFYGAKGGPATAMGSMAGFRAAFRDAQRYRARRAAGDVGGSGKDALAMETLAAVLDGDIPVHIHCYRADEMANMIALSHEFGFHIAAFHHAVEAYKIPRLLAGNGICVATWADWWGLKMEAWDAIQENAAVIDAQPGGCVAIHSDDDEGIQRLNQEAAKVVANARRLGMRIAPEHAIRWLTQEPAQMLGIERQTGTIAAGKMADIVLWDRNPFGSYAAAQQVYIDGVLQLDAAHPAQTPRSDFLLGTEIVR